eukprot:2895135-Heterocapsa_arctica.AAC.1
MTRAPAALPDEPNARASVALEGAHGRADCRLRAQELLHAQPVRQSSRRGWQRRCEARHPMLEMHGGPPEDLGGVPAAEGPRRRAGPPRL